MSQNLISLNLSAADWTDIDAALTTLEQKLTGLLGLTADQRQGLNKMGEKSEAFCRQTLAVLSQNTNLLPPSYDLAEAQADLANIDALRPRFARLRRLTERGTDSETALGSDVMNAALEGYAQLKVSGKAQGLDALRQAMASRFKHGPKASAPAAVPASGTPPTSH